MHIARLDAQKRENKRWKIWFTLEKLVTLHSQIRDGNHSMSDKPYLFRAKKHSQIRDGYHICFVRRRTLKKIKRKDAESQRK